MQIRNNYEKDVYNGDIGRIFKIDTEDQEVTVSLTADRLHTITRIWTSLYWLMPFQCTNPRAPNIPAWSFPCSPSTMSCCREISYTPQSQGEKLVVLVGSKRALAIAVKNDKMQKRYTHLKLKTIRPVIPEGDGQQEAPSC